MVNGEREYSGKPLTKLWDDRGEFGECVADNLTEEDIRVMLREGPLRFLEVNVGHPLRWIPLKERFDFWNTIRSNLYVEGKPYLEDYPGGFIYGASEWMGRDGERLIVLLMIH